MEGRKRKRVKEGVKEGQFIFQTGRVQPPRGSCCSRKDGKKKARMPRPLLRALKILWRPRGWNLPWFQGTGQLHPFLTMNFLCFLLRIERFLLCWVWISSLGSRGRESANSKRKMTGSTASTGEWTRHCPGRGTRPRLSLQGWLGCFAPRPPRPAFSGSQPYIVHQVRRKPG